MRQAEVMLESEADRFYERTRHERGQRDPVSDVIKDSGITPKRVLEIGCSNGWRLASLRDLYACEIVGIEPSQKAAFEAHTMRVPVYRATADSIPALNDEFDVVIYAFCLYLADPSDWFSIVSEGDRVLKSGGHLVIHDFAEADAPFARPYSHRDGILAYHIDFAKLWLSNPLYQLVRRRIFAGDEMVTIIKKTSADTIKVIP